MRLDLKKEQLIPRGLVSNCALLKLDGKQHWRYLEARGKSVLMSGLELKKKKKKKKNVKK